tara:strand:- start:101 stop:229 length:129 start_codon:yes stop_codon:yes gene_type:complete
MLLLFQLSSEIKMKGCHYEKYRKKPKGYKIKDGEIDEEVYEK